MRINGMVKLIQAVALLCVLMALLALTSCQWAEQEEAHSQASPVENFEIEILTDNTASIKGYIGNEKQVVLPTHYQGHSITAVGYRAFSRCETIESVVIGDHILKIGDMAFKDCVALRSIDFGNMKKEFVARSFMNCTALTDVVIPTWMQAIPNGFFNGCTALESVTLHDQVTNISQDAFKGCSSLAEIVIPENCAIGGAAFEGGVPGADAV